MIVFTLDLETENHSFGKIYKPPGSLFTKRFDCNGLLGFNLKEKITGYFKTAASSVHTGHGLSRNKAESPKQMCTIVRKRDEKFEVDRQTGRSGRQL